MNITDRTISKQGRPVPGSYASTHGHKKPSVSGSDKRKPRRRFDRPFLAWDGEGYTDDTGKHHYMMLVASTGDYLLAPEGRSLTTSECFGLLLRVARQYPDHNHIIFGGNYDFNMMLSTVARSEAERLHQTGRAYVGQYRVEIRHRKSLNIRDRDNDDHMILYDVWPFFQSSFVKTLETWGVVADDVERIVAGKAERGRFEYKNHKEILRYCRAELVSLVALMETFRDGLREAGIVVDRWDGPGAVAASLYRQHGTKNHKQVMTGRLENVNKAAQRAYFGGRIESVRFGNQDGGSVFYYDVNSAYPAAIAQLPSLAGGRWNHRKSAASPAPAQFGLYHVRWDLPDGERFYPLPFRRSDGTIAFPPSGAGWYHAPEYGLLQQFFPGEGWECNEWWEFTALSGGVGSGDGPEPHPKVASGDGPISRDSSQGVDPFAWVSEMYDLRRQWKQEGRGAEKALKLGLNSLYGKMVQQLGWREDRGLPPYHQLEWGGAVTSACRATLYTAAMSAPSAVVGFETDGIITTEPLDVVEGSGLGEWGREDYTGVTYVQPGVYWLRTADGEWKSRYRGFDAGSLSRDDVLSVWASGGLRAVAQSTRFIGLGLALHTDWKKFRRWETTPRELMCWPDNPKRDHPLGVVQSCRSLCGPGGSPAERLHRTRVQPITDVECSLVGESEPYPLLWRDNKPGGYTVAKMLADRDFDTYLEDL